LKNTLKRLLSFILALTIIVSIAYAGFKDFVFSDKISIKSHAANNSVLTFTLNESEDAIL